MVRKLRAKMMPPAGAKRPEGTTLDDMAAAFEARIDAEAVRTPVPGSRSFQRLNRAEYARAVKDLLALDIDVTAMLPADTISQGFDNVADAQTFSPALMESYLRAASKVTALALGDRDAEPSEAHYRVPKTASQLQRVDGAPFGTRGGISVMHTFPADGEYVFRVDLHGNADGFLFGAPSADEQIEVSIDGERRALLPIDPKMYEGTTTLVLKSPAIHVPAGSHRVTAAFIQKFEGPVNDLMAPIDHTLADTQIGVAYGITTMPHLKDLAIAGPQKVTGISDTESRRDRLHLPPDLDPQRAGLRHRDRPAAGQQGVPPPGGRRRVHRPDGLLPERPRGARLRGRRRRRARGHPGQPAVPLPARDHARRRDDRDRLQAARRRTGLAAVVLPVGHWPRSGAGRSRPRRAGSPRRGCSSARCGACSPTRAPRRWRSASPASGCGCATSRRSCPTRCSIRTSTARSAGR